MEICARCGAELPPGARFCPSCAAPVDGDAVMAAFGAPLALEDHAERCLHAALALRERVRAVDPRLELRVGVNTGEVVVGRPREGSSFVTGDPVNVAARLEQGAEPSEILVGERTVTAARGAFELGDERTIEAKGKPAGVRCRPLLGALSLMRARGVGGLQSVFVGRDRELERLLAALRGVAEDGRPRLVTIVGDAGVGKTRLVRELWDRLSDHSPQPLRRTGRCLSYGQGITYWPLAEVLKEHFGILEGDGPERVLELLGERRFLALTLGIDVAAGEHPLLVRDRFQDAWADFLAELAAERPVVLLVEDLHWAEEQLLDLLERLVQDVEGRLLVLATSRPELLDRRPGWSSRGRAGLVELEALSPADAQSLLDELLASRLPEQLRAVVVERAEGNPFFVEELLATLIDRGVLQRENGGWAVGELPDDFRIPDSVQAVLAARIDLLEPAEKEALQAAAVIGRVFWPGPVYELVGGEPDLRVLEERDFVRRRSGSSMAGEREYAIKHTLTREVAYASLPKARRARLHAAFAAWLERLGEDPVRPEDADLAWGATRPRPTGCGPEPSPGSVVPLPWRSPGTSSTMHAASWGRLSSSSPTTACVQSSGARSEGSTLWATRVRRSGRRWSGRSRSAPIVRSQPRRMRSSPSRRLLVEVCGGAGRRGSSCRAGSTRRWTWRSPRAGRGRRRWSRPRCGTGGGASSLPVRRRSSRTGWETRSCVHPRTWHARSRISRQ